MPIEDKGVKYSVYVAHGDFVDLQRAINLRLERTECGASQRGDERVPQSLTELIMRAKRQEAGVQPPEAGVP